MEIFSVNANSNAAKGVIVSFETVPAGQEDWPLARIKGTIIDDVDGAAYKYNERSFEGWFDGKPLLGKRVHFLKYRGSQGNVAEDVELE